MRDVKVNHVRLDRLVHTLLMSETFGCSCKAAKPTLLSVMSPVSSAPELRRIQRMEFPVDGLLLTPTLHWESYFENEQHRHMKLLKQRPVKAPWGKECVKSLRSQPAHSQIYLNEDSRLGSTWPVRPVTAITISTLSLNLSVRINTLNKLYKRMICCNTEESMLSTALRHLSE